MRRLRGWEPRSVSTVYGSTGRVLRTTVTVREPEFTRYEVDLLLASRAIADDEYNGDITLSEAVAPEGQFAFEGSGPVTNWAEKARLDKIERYKEENKGVNMNGLVFGVKRRGASAAR